MSVQSTIFLCLFACLMVAWTIVDNGQAVPVNANHYPWNRMAAVGASVKNERVKRSAYYYPDAYDRELQRLFSDYATDRKRAIVDSLGGDYLIRKRES